MMFPVPATLREVNAKEAARCKVADRILEELPIMLGDAISVGKKGHIRLRHDLILDFPEIAGQLRSYGYIVYNTPKRTLNWGCDMGKNTIIQFNKRFKITSDDEWSVYEESDTESELNVDTIEISHKMREVEDV